MASSVPLTDFTYSKRIGEGSYGLVMDGTRTSTGENVAVKINVKVTGY